MLSSSSSLTSPHPHSEEAGEKEQSQDGNFRIVHPEKTQMHTFVPCDLIE